MVVGGDGLQAVAADLWPARRDLPPAGGGYSGWVGLRLDTASPAALVGASDGHLRLRISWLWDYYRGEILCPALAVADDAATPVGAANLAEGHRRGGGSVGLRGKPQASPDNGGAWRRLPPWRHCFGARIAGTISKAWRRWATAQAT